MSENIVKLTREQKILLIKALKDNSINTKELAKAFKLNILDVEQVTGMEIK